MSTYTFSQHVLIPSLQQMLDSEDTKMRKISDVHTDNGNTQKCWDAMGEQLTLPEGSRKGFSNVTLKLTLKK